MTSPEAGRAGAAQRPDARPGPLAEGRYSTQRASLYARRNDALDLAAKIVELLDDPARRAEIGKYGRRRVENELAWKHGAPKLLAAHGALWGSNAISHSERGVDT